MGNRDELGMEETWKRYTHQPVSPLMHGRRVPPVLAPGRGMRRQIALKHIKEELQQKESKELY